MQPWGAAYAEGQWLRWEAIHLDPLLPSLQEAPDPRAYARVNTQAQQFLEEVVSVYCLGLFNEGQIEKDVSVDLGWLVEG